MKGIGQGFSSGIETFNNNVLVHIGRQCPTSWTELKANVSRNVKTCAKACTVFLDSSLGVAFAMGVVGMVTTSLCIGENMMEIIANNLLPMSTETAALSNDELVYLCMRGNAYIPTFKTQAPRLQNWTVGAYGICQNGKILADHDIYCVSLKEYRERFPFNLVPECQSTNWTGYSERKTGEKYLSYVFMLVTDSAWGISDMTHCVSAGVFSMMNASDTSVAAVVSQATCMPVSVKNGTDNTNAGDGIDRGAYCWNKSENIHKKYPKYFTNTTNCPLAISTTLAPSITSMPLTTAFPVEENNCPPCSLMMIAFGVGSAVVLMTTLGKIIYKQCKAKGLKKAKSCSKRFKSLAALTLEEGLLLGASGLGTGVLVTSLLPPCGPLDESTKKIVMASTACYWTSAASRLLSNCITSPLVEECTAAEDKVVELPMLTDSEVALKVSGTSDDEKGDETMIPVVVVIDSLEEPSTSKSCC
ncbi:hypothetical protein CLAVI_001043 [Candidatus Clavichlamydia salmonicola]|uniref:hypothetical protein n=1 Tax=Candidatus Clavichlamydia salmonicola TaxID=469812 RepID=UPI00189109EB|nr:hypothetical protein [Candidatus Clavichlamydia salmonicola]MBF5051398.1 hypothetical protein [Candidatus Clavichlamydia salmonicola]